MWKQQALKATVIQTQLEVPRKAENTTLSHTHTIDFLFNQPKYLESIQVRLTLQGKTLKITAKITGYFPGQLPFLSKH